MLALVLLTGFVGFGIKAGFMPFHVWLPNAHPAAPAHVSSLLSAINIKAGIYGIARLIMIMPARDAAYGWGMLAVSLVSAVLGVWYALAQHDIKKLLAYHSVENIGIIGLGLSIAWLGRCYAVPELVALGFAGALLHTLNHAIFKGLLFFGAGNVYLQAHTGDIEQMGGFARVIPVTAVAFLVGAISICGLPPFNGFVSEFIIYKSFFRGGDSAVGLCTSGDALCSGRTRVRGRVGCGLFHEALWNCLSRAKPLRRCLPPAARTGFIFGRAVWVGRAVRVDRCSSRSRPAPCCACAGRGYRRCSSAARLGVTARPIADCLRAFPGACVYGLYAQVLVASAEPARASARLGVVATRL